MKDHYRVLDLPKNATEEQIRSQYKLLVRVYHPDRFSKPEDRAYAEQKIKEVNEAYNALLRPAAVNQSFSDPDQPVPVVIPSYIDFGTLFPGERKTVPLAISNARGQVHELHFDFSDSRSWFVLNEAKLLTTTADSQLQFEVVANTNELDPGRTYKAWIDVRMQKSVTRVNLSIKVARERNNRRSAPRPYATYALVAVLVLLLSAGALFAPRLLSGLLAANQTDPVTEAPQSEPTAATTTNPQSATAVAAPSGATTAPERLLLKALIAPSAGNQPLETHFDQLDYAIVDGSKVVLYTSQFDGKGQQKLTVSGESLAWSSDGTKLAYLAPVNGNPQIFLRSATDKASIQLTDTANPKRALAWSPDSSRLAYLQADSPEQDVLYLLTVNGKTGEAPQAIKPSEQGTILSFAWHPDSINLLVAQRVVGVDHVYRASSQASDLQQLTKFESRDPAWSPDGAFFAVASTEGVFVVDAQASNPRQLSNKPAQKPMWSQDGKQLAFLTNSSNAKPELWLLPIENPTNNTGKPSQIASNVVNFAWSFYSDRLAYITGDLQKTGLSTLYLWNLEPGKEAKLVSEINAPTFNWIP